MCEAAIWRANSRPIPDEAPVMSAHGPNRLLSTLAFISIDLRGRSRVPYGAAIWSLPRSPLTEPAFYLVTATKIAVLAWACQEIYISIARNNVTAPPKQRGRPRGFDRDEALESAIRLFWSRGYEATSISELTPAMDITPPSLYAAFGDKKPLFLEPVEPYQQETASFPRRPPTNEHTAELAIRRLLLD